ncbi:MULTISPECIES: MoaD/ThiS family protein [unclassified Arthrobacter]|uniref:MoaD/ThiS family protein n=1 Tax=unclassified Arthrobacter TaxID=235627 RepID=UPI0024E02233|nr:MULTISPECIES: MoaD/ThiS family protein [unclassified Arthrobacter]MCC9144323.1 MoaD/ThiS family protein [Arthrobacter sp. zg-Y919]MDK1275549.1 MoaD/ThiS family protein [Arthrobacter sp. zg.Y919]WIB03076.1 MoaD/ThiS family protein [Arthrobacter sp. zg-Y919]
MSAPSRFDAPGRTAAVGLVLPAALADAADGQRLLALRPGSGHGTAGDVMVADVLTLLQVDFPGVYRRICDETGRVRRYVNLYLDGEDIRDLDGASTVLPDRAELLVLQSIAGG